MTSVFLDASVYFAGFYSKSDASALILELGRRRKVTLVASRLVLREADRNLRKKASPAVLKAFRRFLQGTKIRIISPPDEKLFKPYEDVLNPKDLPVLVAALESEADYLITLDRKHFLTPQLLNKIKKIKVMTSADFIQQIYLKGKL